MWVNFRLHRPIFHKGLNLLLQFDNRARTATGDGLITRRENPLHVERAVQRIDRHQCDGGGAIWISDDSTMQLHVITVDFWNDKRNVRIHPEHGGVIDHDGA